MVGRPRPKVVCRRWGPKWATNGRQLVDPSRPTIQYFTSSYTSCGTLSPDPHTATVVIKLVVMTSSSFLFSFLISSAFSAIQHEVSDIHRGLTCNMQYAICNITISNKYFSRVWMRTGRKSCKGSCVKHQTVVKPFLIHAIYVSRAYVKCATKVIISA